MEEDKELKKLYSDLKEITARINEIEGKKSYEEHKALIGKCFRVHDTYGDKCKGWYKYIHIVNCSQGGWLDIGVIEKRTDGSYLTKEIVIRNLQENYEEITEDDFRDAVMDIHLDFYNQCQNILRKKGGL